MTSSKTVKPPKSGKNWSRTCAVYKWDAELRQQKSKQCSSPMSTISLVLEPRSLWSSRWGVRCTCTTVWIVPKENSRGTPHKAQSMDWGPDWGRMPSRGIREPTCGPRRISDGLHLSSTFIPWDLHRDNVELPWQQVVHSEAGNIPQSDPECSR